MATEVEKFVKYAAMVDTMPLAWSFVMTYVDEFVAPDIEITAVQGLEDEDGPITFEAQVYGLVKGNPELDKLRSSLRQLADGYAEADGRYTGLEVANHLTEILG